MNSFLKRAKLIALEGPDMLGKTTQAKLLLSFFEKQNKHVLYLKAPLKQCFMTYKLVYWMLNNGYALKFQNLFQIIQFVNKFIFQLFYLPFISIFYDYIIFDRWKLSSMIYSIATNVNRNILTLMLTLTYDPDFTIILSGESLEVDKQLDKYETNTLLQSVVKRLYYSWSVDNNDHCHVLINANDVIDVVYKNIVTSIKNFDKNIV